MWEIYSTLPIQTPKQCRNIPTPFSSVSIVDFEQVNVSWGVYLNPIALEVLQIIPTTKNNKSTFPLTNFMSLVSFYTP